MRSKLYQKILGKKVIALLLLSFVVGCLLFLTEYLFAFSLQIFLAEIGLTLTAPDNLVSRMVPKEYGLLFFIIIGTSRSIFIGFKTYLSGASNQSFLSHQRKIILKNSLINASTISSHEVGSLFSETLNRAASCILDLTVVITAGITTVLLLLSGFRIAPIEMTIGMGLLVLILLPTKFLNMKIKNFGSNITLNWELINKRLNEGVKFNYFFLAHGFIDKAISDGNDEIDSYENSYKSFFINSVIKNNIPNLFGILIIVIIAFIGKKHIHTEASILLAFIYIFFRSAQGGSEVLAAYNSFIFNRHGLYKIIEFNETIDNEKTNLHKPDEVEIVESIKNICFNNIDFSYSRKKIFTQLTFQVTPDSPLVIKGESGVGKSTLISLLLGANRPDSGDVYANNNTIYKSLNSFRKKVAYIGPEAYIFNDTIKNNLLLSSEEKNPISDEKIIQVLKDLEIDYFVSQFPDGLNHKFSENANISTGQKQRIALARAVLRQPDIYILDEATANLDPDIESRILINLQKYFQGKIIIIVSHKNSFDYIRKQELLVYKNKEGENEWSLNTF